MADREGEGRGRGNGKGGCSGTEGRRRSGRGAYCLCDLYWPDYKLAVEYDSAEFHGDAPGRDAARRDRLKAAGVTVLPVGNAQMADFRAFYDVARRLARLMGRRPTPRERGYTWLARAHDLHARITQTPEPVTARLLEDLR